MLEGLTGNKKNTNCLSLKCLHTVPVLHLQTEASGVTYATPGMSYLVPTNSLENYNDQVAQELNNFLISQVGYPSADDKFVTCPDNTSQPLSQLAKLIGKSVEEPVQPFSQYDGTGSSNAQSLAYMLQTQLDAINSEIQLIQVGVLFPSFV